MSVSFIVSFLPTFKSSLLFSIIALSFFSNLSTILAHSGFLGGGNLFIST